MIRFFERGRRFHLAATLTMFLAAVSVAHVDDHGMLSQGAPLSADVLASWGSATEIRATTSGAPSDSDHDCSCLLCTATVSDSARGRILPPSAGRLAGPGGVATAGSLHLPPVFHPPSA